MSKIAYRGNVSQDTANSVTLIPLLFRHFCHPSSVAGGDEQAGEARFQVVHAGSDVEGEKAAIPVLR